MNTIIHTIEQFRRSQLMLKVVHILTQRNCIQQLHTNKNPKFKVGDHVRNSKYKNIFAKGYTPNWSEEVFVIKKVQNTVPWTYVINDLTGDEIIGKFYENYKRQSTRI